MPTRVVHLFKCKLWFVIYEINVNSVACLIGKCENSTFDDTEDFDIGCKSSKISAPYRRCHIVGNRHLRDFNKRMTFDTVLSSKCT